MCKFIHIDNLAVEAHPSVLGCVVSVSLCCQTSIPRVQTMINADSDVRVVIGCLSELCPSRFGELGEFCFDWHCDGGRHPVVRFCVSARTELADFALI